MSRPPSHDGFIEALRTIFGKRTIIFGEDPEKYYHLVTLIANDVKPQTMREWLMVKDIVDAQWEFWRMRGFKASLLNVTLPEIIANGIKNARGKELTLRETTLMREQLLRVLNDEPGARVSFATLLAESHLTMEGIATTAFQRQLPLQLDIEQRVDTAHQRRNRAYAELEALRQQTSARADTPSLSGRAQSIREIDAPGSIAPAHPAEAGPREAGQPQARAAEPLSEGGRGDDDVERA